MICLFSIFSGSILNQGSALVSLTSTTNDCFERHSSVLCQGILWKSHHFPVSFFIFPLPFLSCVLDWLSRGCWLGSSLPCFGCCRFADPNSHLFWCLNFCSILTFQNQMSLKVFDTHLGAQGMESILVSFWYYCGVVLVILLFICHF
jgi:hypothetical protein